MAGANGATQPDEAELFDLDALERDTTQPEPFQFTIEGRVYELVNMGDLDWHVQTTLLEGEAAKILTELLVPGDFAEFDKVRLPIWKLDKLVKAWAVHNGIDVGEPEASPASSNRAARRSRPTSGRTTASASRTSRRGN